MESSVIDWSKPVTSFDQAVDELVTLLTMQTPSPRPGETSCDVPPVYFDRLEPLPERWQKFLRIMDPLGQQERVIFANATPDDLGEPLDLSFIAETTDDTSALHVCRYRTVSRPETRGRVVQYYQRFLVEWSMGEVTTNGRFASGRNYITSKDGHKWIAIGDTRRGGSFPRPLKPEDSKTVNVVVGLQMSRFYDWRVSLGFAGNPTVSLPTTPEGCREVFKLRDIPEGRARRLALRHWVTEHWRRGAGETTDEEKRVFVRQHLSGSNRFNWHGVTCVIEPSRHDLKRLGLTRDKP